MDAPRSELAIRSPLKPASAADGGFILLEPHPVDATLLLRYLGAEPEPSPTPPDESRLLAGMIIPATEHVPERGAAAIDIVDFMSATAAAQSQHQADRRVAADQGTPAIQRQTAISPGRRQPLSLAGEWARGIVQDRLDAEDLQPGNDFPRNDHGEHPVDQPSDAPPASPTIGLTRQPYVPQIACRNRRLRPGQRPMTSP